MHGSWFGARLSAGWLLAGSLLLAIPASAATPQQAGAASAPAPAHASSGKGTRVAQASRRETQPAWTDLGADQRAALQPLAGTWATLSEAQKRKWIAMSRNFDRMAPEEKAKLHSRMNDWVMLSPQQRAQARLNFGETRSLPAEDRKAKWEAYQALSPEEKRKLAAGANARTPPTAAAVKPVPAQRLANVPRGERGAKTPRIATGPADEPQPVAAPGTPGKSN
jgi:hypothetical protein